MTTSRVLTLRRTLVPLAVAGVVLALVLAALHLRTGAAGQPGTASGGRPPVLHLAQTGWLGSPMAQSATVTGATSGEGMPGVRGGGPAFVLTGTLPDGPASARVATLSVDTRIDAAALAAVLGLTGKPQAIPGGHQWTGAVGTLMVYDTPAGAASGEAWGMVPGAWSFFRGAVDLPVAASDAPTAEPTTVDPGTVDPSSPAAPVGSTAQVDDVLRTVGLHPAAAVRTGDSGWTSVSVDPDVDGARTTGLATQLSTSGGVLVSAQGFLTRVTPGADYPIISAAAAFKELQSRPIPQPMMLCPQIAPDAPAKDSSDSSGQSTPVPSDPSGGSEPGGVVGPGPLGCGRPAAPANITGAQLGLVLDGSDTGPLLVPAWLFSVEGSDVPLPMIAVEPAYLAVSDGPGGIGGIGGTVGGGTSTGGGSSTGGSSGSAGGTAVAPPPPSASGDPSTPNGRFTSVARSSDDRSIDVTFFGGVETCYSYTVDAEETGATVTLNLREKSRGQDVCIDLAREYTINVPLAEPLGVRRVVDAVSGETLLGPTR